MSFLQSLLFDFNLGSSVLTIPLIPTRPFITNFRFMSLPRIFVTYLCRYARPIRMIFRSLNGRIERNAMMDCTNYYALYLRVLCSCGIYSTFLCYTTRHIVVYTIQIDDLCLLSWLTKCRYGFIDKVIRPKNKRYPQVLSSYIIVPY